MNLQKLNLKVEAQCTQSESPSNPCKLAFLLDHPLKRTNNARSFISTHPLTFFTVCVETTQNDISSHPRIMNISAHKISQIQESNLFTIEEQAENLKYPQDAASASQSCKSVFGFESHRRFETTNTRNSPNLARNATAFRYPHPLADLRKDIIKREHHTHAPKIPNTCLHGVHFTWVVRVFQTQNLEQLQENIERLSSISPEVDEKIVNCVASQALSAVTRISVQVPSTAEMPAAGKIKEIDGGISDLFFEIR